MDRLTGPAIKAYFSAIHALSAIGLSTLMVNHGRCSTAAQSHITLLGYFSRTAYSRLQEAFAQWREAFHGCGGRWLEGTRELGSFVQAYGSKWVDASLLLLPLVGNAAKPCSQ